MVNKRNFVLFVLLLVPLLLLAACSDPVKPVANLTVKVFDKYDNSLSATVELYEYGTNTPLATKTGEVVTFEDVNQGNYRVVASRDNVLEKPEKTVIVNSKTVTVEIKFGHASSACVQEVILEASDEKKITIPDLKQGEYVVMGVSPFIFDSEDDNTSTMEVNLTRVTNGTSTQNNIVSLGQNNPEYVFREPPEVEMPKIFSVDEYLRKTENELLKYRPGFASLPVFGPDAYSLGDPETFNYQDFETGIWKEIDTTVRAVGEHCYIFVDDNVDYLSDDIINSFAGEFDNKIFPNNTSFYNDGFDIDQNNKLGIVILDMGMTDFTRGVIVGYFWGIDFFDQDTLDYLTSPGALKTNTGDFIYLNAQVLDPTLDFGFTPDVLLSTIAHEFQHEQYFYNSWENNWLFSANWVSDTWINEGMSTYAEQLNGYEEVDSRIYYYFDNDDPISQNSWLLDTSIVSLLYWSGEIADYGISNLFTNYIVEQFGNGVIQAVYGNDGNTDPIDLVSNYAARSFEDIFMDWMIANKLHSLRLAPEYSYDLPLEGDPSHSPLTTNYSARSYYFRNSAVKYFLIYGDGTDIELEIEGTAADKKLGVFLYRY